MDLSKGIIQTPVTRPGMQIGEALRICVEHGVPGLPFVDAAGTVAGRFSVRHTFLIASLTPDMIQGAHLIGHEAHHIEHHCDHYEEVFGQPIDDSILADITSLSSDAPIIKAVAMMEKTNSAYLFVIDNGDYRGVVTRLGLTRVLLEAMT